MGEQKWDGLVSIPIIFGWLRFHRKEQLCLCAKPLLVCHWQRARWMRGFVKTYTKRLFCIGKRDTQGHLDDFDAWYSRE